MSVSVEVMSRRYEADAAVATDGRPAVAEFRPLSSRAVSTENPDPAEAAAPARKRRFVDLSPLRQSPPFARLWIGTAIAGIGAQLTIVAVGLQIYDITHSTFAVSLVGGIAL